MNIEKLRAMFSYSDGRLVRLVTINYLAKEGDVAGTIDKSTGYTKVNFDGKVRLAHRLIWTLVNGREPDGFIDHIDGNRSNNRIENMRCCDNSTNMQNLKKARVDSSTGVLGVSLCKDTGKYVSRIRVGKKYRNLGRFESIQQASNAYITEKRVVHTGCTI